MSTSTSNPQVGVRKHFTSSILLWMRTDQPRQKGMDHWKGPHSGIISATPGLEEYRQIHLAEDNPGLWPATERRRDADPRRPQGSTGSPKSPSSRPSRRCEGRKQTKLAFKDEVNVFRRTLLYAGPPDSSRWYDVAGPGENVGARASIYLRRRDGVRAGEFRKVRQERAGPRAHRHRRAAGSSAPQTFLPWNEKTLGHPKRRPRQPGRPALPRLAHPRVRRPGRPDGVLRSGRDRDSSRRRSPRSPRRSTPTTSPQP